MQTLFNNTCVYIIAVTLVSSVVGCGSQANPGSADGSQLGGAVKIDGSSTVYPISAAVAEEFLKENPRVRATVGISGTGGGFKKFIAGEIDICDASRAIKAREKEACQNAGIDFVLLEVAYDGLAVVVHPANDWIDCLTVDQLKEIWRPQSAVKKWSDLNSAWPDEEIKLYGPGTDSGTFDYFTKAIVGEEKASRADYTASEDDNVLVRGVTADRFALGYFGYAYYAENKDKLKLVGVSEDDGSCVTPSQQSVRDGSYKPLSRPLFIYVNSTALKRPEVAVFIRFYLKEVGDLATEIGYVEVSDKQHQRNTELVENIIKGPSTVQQSKAATVVDTLINQK